MAKGCTVLTPKEILSAAKKRQGRKLTRGEKQSALAIASLMPQYRCKGLGRIRRKR